MDASVVTAGAAVMGSLVGALASLASNWFTQRYQSRRDHLARQVTRRESLYTEFINESARMYSDALVHNLDDPRSMATLWSLLARIRLSASPRVLAAAERVAGVIGEQFQATNLTTDGVQALFLANGDPLEEFGVACRAELDAIDRVR